MGSFAYALDPMASDLVLKHIPATSIIVFDEAHNIDDVCCEFLSMFMSQRMLDQSAESITAIEHISTSVREREQQQLQAAFDRLKQTDAHVGPASVGLFQEAEIPDYILRSAMPTLINRAADFVGSCKKLIQFYGAFIEGHIGDAAENQFTIPEVLAAIEAKCELDKETLKFMNYRLSQLLTKLRVPALKDYAAMEEVLTFTSVLANQDEGYCVFVDQTQDGSIMQVACLDSTIAFNHVLEKFTRVVVTSGTLSPLATYPRLLDFEPVCMRDFAMTFSRRCLLPLIVTKGNGQTPLSSSFGLRSDPRVPRNYGDLLLNFCQIVPDGVVCFFPSYVYLQLVFRSWSQTGVLTEIMKHKLIFLEAEVADETSVALVNYRKAIECGRGAVFLGVARGRVSEGIDFADHYGRCVLLFGLPVRNTSSKLVQTRADFVEKKYGLNRKEFILFDAMRAASQCVGRLLRSKNDYGIVVLADRRYARDNLKSQLPHWIRQFVNQGRIGLTTDEAVQQTTQFLLQMAQPFKHNPDQLISFAEE
jgi:DNA excision repair protein ERCC-2